MLQHFNTPFLNANQGVPMTGTADFGQTAVLQPPADATVPTLIRNDLALDDPEQGPIPAGQSRVVNFDLPACAVTNSHYLLYLNQFPLELSLELYANGASCCLPGPSSIPQKAQRTWARTSR